MKRFQFQFAAILQLRKTREEDALRALGAAQRAHGRALADKEALEKKLGEALQRREALGGVPTSTTAFAIEQDFIDGQKNRIMRQDQVIIRAQRSIEKAFRTYLSARRQTQMMERLQERHYEAFKRARARAETKELEDLAVMRVRLVEAERNEDAELDGESGEESA